MKNANGQQKPYILGQNSILYSFQQHDELWIDFVDQKEIFFSIMICSLILISTIYTGFHAKPNVMHQQNFKSYNTLQRTSLRRQLSYSISPISSYNRFIFAYISFERQNFTTGNIFREVYLEYSVKQYFKGQHEMVASNLHLDCSIPHDKNVSEKFILFNNYFIKSDMIDINIVVPNGDNATFSKHIVDTYYGSKEFTSFRLYFCSIFFIFIIFYLISINFFSSPYLRLHFIFILLVVIFLANNPFFFFHVFYPTKIYAISSIFFEPICDAYIYFSAWIFLELYLCRIHAKNEEKFQKNFLICSLLSIFYFLLSFFNETTVIQYFVFQFFPETNDEKVLNLITKTVSILKMLLSIIEFIIISVKIINIKPKSAKLLIFWYLASLAFAQQSIFDGFLKFKYSHLYQENERTKIWISKFSFQNIFCLFSAFVHWPYKKREHIVDVSDSVPHKICCNY